MGFGKKKKHPNLPIFQRKISQQRLWDFEHDQAGQQMTQKKEKAYIPMRVTISVQRLHSFPDLFY